MITSKQLKGFMVALTVLSSSVTVSGLIAAQEATPEVTEATPSAQTDTSTRPYLGLRLAAVEDSAVIHRVLPGSPADEAGLQEGDVITSVNGTAVVSAAEVSDAVAALSVGDSVSLGIERDGEASTVDVVLGSAPNRPVRAAERQHGARLAYDADAQTWQVEALSEDSPLYEAGLRAGDVITAVDGTQYDPQGLAEYLASLDEDSAVALTVERDGAAQEISVSVSNLSFGRHGMPGMPRFGGNRGSGRPGNGDPMNQGNRPGRGGIPGQNMPDTAPPVDENAGAV